MPTSRIAHADCAVASTSTSSSHLISRYSTDCFAVETANCRREHCRFAPCRRGVWNLRWLNDLFSALRRRIVMLVLSRKTQETVIVGGGGGLARVLKVTVLEI